MSPDELPPAENPRRETDALLRIADAARLTFAVEAVLGAPWDPTTPPSESDAFYVVTVSAEDASVTPIRAVFIGLASDADAPSAGAVLWWLAADAWMLEQSGRDLGTWCSVYNYGVDEPATRRLFSLQVRQADALRRLLGRAGYAALLGTYASETRREPVDWDRWDEPRESAERDAVS